eukprot:GDKJ01029729.1.p1 GENE.GDKJ01029729.1~~GDKJ01029729.1.p1  ORF type:complete len:889 (+),score=208.92 GDKJ01029729.1:27-2669(+)
MENILPSNNESPVSVSVTPLDDGSRICSLSFSNDSSEFVASTNTGFRVVSSDSLQETVSYENLDLFPKGVKLVSFVSEDEPVFLVLLNDLNSLKRWHIPELNFKMSLSFKSPIERVTRVSDYLSVSAGDSVHIVRISKNEIVSSLRICSNQSHIPQLIHFPPPNTAWSLIYAPSSSPNSIKIVHQPLNLSSPPSVQSAIAHQSPLSALAVTQDGSLCLTTSFKNTIVRVFETTNCTLVAQIRIKVGYLGIPLVPASKPGKERIILDIFRYSHEDGKCIVSPPLLPPHNSSKHLNHLPKHTSAPVENHLIQTEPLHISSSCSSSIENAQSHVSQQKNPSLSVIPPPVNPNFCSKQNCCNSASSTPLSHPISQHLIVVASSTPSSLGPLQCFDLARYLVPAFQQEQNTTDFNADEEEDEEYDNNHTSDGDGSEEEQEEQHQTVHTSRRGNADDDFSPLADRRFHSSQTEHRGSQVCPSLFSQTIATLSNGMSNVFSHAKDSFEDVASTTISVVHHVLATSIPSSVNGVATIPLPSLITNSLLKNSYKSSPSSSPKNKNGDSNNNNNKNQTSAAYPKSSSSMDNEQKSSPAQHQKDTDRRLSSSSSTSSLSPPFQPSPISNKLNHPAITVSLPLPPQETLPLNVPPSHLNDIKALGRVVDRDGRVIFDFPSLSSGGGSTALSMSSSQRTTSKPANSNLLEKSSSFSLKAVISSPSSSLKNPQMFNAANDTSHLVHVPLSIALSVWRGNLMIVTTSGDAARLTLPSHLLPSGSHLCDLMQNERKWNCENSCHSNCEGGTAVNFCDLVARQQRNRSDSIWKSGNVFVWFGLGKTSHISEKKQFESEELNNSTNFLDHQSEINKNQTYLEKQKMQVEADEEKWVSI